MNGRLMLEALRCKPCCFIEILRTLTSLSLGADQQVIRFAGGWIDPVQ